jgi:hypothetical protein
MFITIFNAIKEQLSTVAELQWHRGTATPVQTPGIVFELPKEIQWEQEPEKVLKAHAPLTLHLVTDAPMEPDVPVQAEELKKHFEMADSILRLLYEFEVLDNKGRILAYGFNPGPVKPARIDKGMVTTILTLDVLWVNYALIKEYTAFKTPASITLK